MTWHNVIYLEGVGRNLKLPWLCAQVPLGSCAAALASGAVAQATTGDEGQENDGNGKMNASKSALQRVLRCVSCPDVD